jgi:RNA polymerase sigma-70 factor (ECF subfamily)
LADPAPRHLPLAEESVLAGLMRRYQEGDRPAAEELIRLVSPMLYRYLAWPAAAPAEAEDLLQECWLRIHRARHTYRAPAPLLPWVFAIARHTKIDCWRRRSRIESREVAVDWLPEKGALPSSDHLEANELLSQLPESQREVLLMMKVSGMSLGEVARATSSTVGAVKQKAHRAYQRLRRLMEGREGPES